MTDQENGQAADTELCQCGHPLDQHDAIASRYCAATVSGNLQRGCVCARAAAVTADAR